MKNEANEMRRRKLYVLACVGLYLASLIATAPAGIMEWMLPRLSQNRVFLAQAEGGLWRGSARSLLVKTAGGELISLGSVNWEALFLPLLKLELAARLELADGRNVSYGVLAAGWRKLHLRQINATVPIALLPEFVPVWQTWKPDGELKFNTDDLTLRPQGVQGKAALEWRNASTGLSRVKPLGDYRVNIEGGQKTAQINLSTISGVLRLAGTGEWSPGGGLGFRGTAQGDPSRKADLQDLLKLLGSEQGNDVYLMEISHLK